MTVAPDGAPLSARSAASLRAPRRPHGRRSLRARIVATTAVMLGVLAAMSMILFWELGRRDVEQLVATKLGAGATVADLTARSLAAPLEFDDDTAIQGVVDRLKTDPEIAYVGVWSEGSAAVRAWFGSSEVTGAPREARATVLPSRVMVERPVTSRSGAALGGVRVELSFESVMEANRRARARMLVTTLIFAFVLTVFLLWSARRAVLGPLSSLSSAAAKLGEGDLSARAAVVHDDEMGDVATTFNEMAASLADREKKLEAASRNLRDLEIAKRIQTSLLPGRCSPAGLDIAARMVTASEVGGDYYDVVPFEKGCWLAVGDVSGHGLSAGLVMLMIQSAIASLVRMEDGAGPGRVLQVANAVVFDNVHHRLGQSEHITMSLLRHDEGGDFVMAGAHQDIVIHRAELGRSEVVRTTGAWLGLMEGADGLFPETKLHLAPGDVMLLYSDGLIEAANGEGEMLGLARVRAELEGAHDAPAEAICERLFETALRWTGGEVEDDVSIMVIRRRAAA
ncbi:MAG: SpoIIE family protein phosphatase [Byssovorax sp.]